MLLLEDFGLGASHFLTLNFYLLPFSSSIFEVLTSAPEVGLDSKDNSIVF
jgi:hypothetical protein